MPFVVGVARSGTTLLRLMLDAHPELAIPAETGFIPAVQGLGGDGPELREAFFRAVTAAPTWPDLGLSADEFRAALGRIEPFSVSDGIRGFYGAYAARLGKRRGGDKTPMYGLHLRMIRGLLPEARFIHVIRDGRDVALSLRGLWFSPGDRIEDLAAHWARQIAETREQAAGLDHYLEVRYEELITRTRPVLRRICRFLDLPYSRAMEAYHRRSEHRLGEVQTRYDAEGRVVITREQRFGLHRLTRRSPDPSRIGKWRARMTPAELDAFEAHDGGWLDRLGYETRGRSAA